MAERLGKDGKYGILLYDNLKGCYHIAIFNIRNDAEQIYTACRKLLNLYNSKSITDMVYYEEQNTSYKNCRSRSWIFRKEIK